MKLRCGSWANTNILDQVSWVSSTLAGKPGGGHAFVFSHKNLMGQNHVDMLFGKDPSQNLNDQTTFIDAMFTNGARYSFSGHDHIYQHSLVKAPNSSSAIHNIITASDSNKFYIPLGNTEWTGLAANDPAKAIDNFYDKPPRETTFAQERYKIGYFIVTVDGSKVMVDYYSADNTGAALDPVAKEYLISTTPALAFTKKDTFGYDLNGHEYLVPQGDSYTDVDETYNATAAKILGGTNNSTAQDGNGRHLTKDVNTGWAPKDNDVLASDIFTLWGMADLGSDQTDVFTLSISYDNKRVRPLHLGNGGFGIATRDAEGNWVNAVDANFGGTKNFVVGPWNPSYELGTYGVDSSTHAAWAVINYNGDFAVARDIEPVPGHRK